MGTIPAAAPALPLQPTRCLQTRPNRKTVYFAGQPINLCAITVYFDGLPFDHSYLSLIFQGKRRPRAIFAQKLAEALGMDFGAFVDAQEEKVREYQASRRKKPAA